jgi:hypothetical protein
VTIDGVWNGEWIFLTTYTHDSELQAITAPPLISTRKLTQHPLSLFQPAVSSQPFPGNGLTVEVLQLHALKSPFPRLPYRNDQPCPLLTSRHGSHRRHASSIVAFVSVAAGKCLPSRCPELPYYIRLSRCHFIATALHATIEKHIILITKVSPLHRS